MADDKKADKYLGGMSGEAAKKLKSRKQQLDEAIDGTSEKESPNRNGTQSDGRPAPSTKF